MPDHDSPLEPEGSFIPLGKVPSALLDRAVRAERERDELRSAIVDLLELGIVPTLGIHDEDFTAIIQRLVGVGVEEAADA